MTLWPFSRKYSILESGNLDGGTDWQCHILQVVDNGKSQRMLNVLEPGTVMPIHRHRDNS